MAIGKYPDGQEDTLSVVKGEGLYFISGSNKKGTVLFANRRLPEKQNGIVIISSGGFMEAQTLLRIVCYCTRNAIDRFIARVYPLKSRVEQKGVRKA